MKDSGFKLNKEKVFGTIISFAIILTLGYGIYSVAVNSGRKENQENIVNLKQAFSDPRIQTWLKTTDDPLVKDVLVPVSAE